MSDDIKSALEREAAERRFMRELDAGAEVWLASGSERGEADWRARAEAAESTLASIRAEASVAAEACAQALKRDTLASLIGVAQKAVQALDRILLLCDGEADS